MGGLRIKKSMVHVYTGDGKGKTTAALGLALRVIGWGGRVSVIQFIKGYPDIGEAFFAGICPQCFELRQFAHDDSPGIKECDVRARVAEARAALDCARETISRGNYDLVVLDEINNALHYGLVSTREVLDMLAARPAHVEVVLTGRNAPQEILEAADYVTVMTGARHPLDRGIGSRKGIDY